MEAAELHKLFIQNKSQMKIVGELSTGKGRIPLGIYQDQRVDGLWLLGKTGTGKSQLMRNMALEDIAEGKCVIFFDPYGNQIEAITPRIIEKDSERLVYLNAQHIRNVLGLPTKEDLKNLIRAHQVLLIDFELNKLGADKVSTYGTAILQRVYSAALELFANRKDVYLYIDDIHLFQKHILGDMLSHTNQLHINITASNQSFSQLDPEVLKLMQDQMQSRMWFNMDESDVDWLSDNFTKHLGKQVSDLKEREFILDTELEQGRRENIKGAAIK